MCKGKSTKNFFVADKICAGYGEKEIIHDIRFSIEPHTLTALIGPNGCGKTTLLKSIVNLLDYKGTCTLQGEVLKDMSVQKLAKKISYIPQRGGINISMPVMDVVLMGYNPVLKLLQRPSAGQIQKAREALVMVGMSRYEKTDYLTLSEGQKQLVLLARTMIEDTSLMILDEPDSALDFQNKHRILQLLEQMIKKEEKAGILCIHDPAVALEFCQQLIVMKDGHCVEILRPATDSLEVMEKVLRKIYGNVSLNRCTGKNGEDHLVLLWEGEKCDQ